MIKLAVKMVKRPPAASEFIKQMNFGTAKGLTDTAKDGQKAVVSALGDKFTLRGTWWQQNMRHGIKITPAKRDKLTAEVKTLADWLEMHEKGGTKMPKGNSLAIPTWQLRPKGSKKILRSAMRPKQLLASGKAFILDTPKGKVIAQIKGKDRLVVLYGLEPQVKIRKRSTFYEPIERATKQNLHPNIKRGIAFAFSTMKK